MHSKAASMNWGVRCVCVCAWDKSPTILGSTFGPLSCRNNIPFVGYYAIFGMDGEFYIWHMDHIMGPTLVLVFDLCLLGLPGICELGSYLEGRGRSKQF